MKIVINACFGGFGVSHEGMLRFFEIKEIDVYPTQGVWVLYPTQGVWDMWTYWLVPESERALQMTTSASSEMSIEERQLQNKLYDEQTIWASEIPRDDAALVQVVEELGDAANGKHAVLTVVEIPDDVNWYIDEYDGSEHVAERHRTWR